MKKYQSFSPENFQFLEMKFSIYLYRRVFVMGPDSAKAQTDLNLGWTNICERYVFLMLQLVSVLISCICTYMLNTIIFNIL